MDKLVNSDQVGDIPTRTQSRTTVRVLSAIDEVIKSGSESGGVKSPVTSPGAGLYPWNHPSQTRRFIERLLARNIPLLGCLVILIDYMHCTKCGIYIKYGRDWL